MITSKTYSGTETLNYIESAELALTDVYLVKREGLLHEKFITGSPNRTYSYDSVMGRIYFPLNFNVGGEKVFVIYRETSTVPVVTPVCVDVLVAGTLPNGIIGVPYSYTFILSGTAPFVLSAITAPGWASVALAGAGTLIQVTGTPNAETTENIEFTVTNCSAGSQTVDQDFDVINPTPLMNIFNNSASGVFINSLGGIPYTIQSGSFPIGNGQQMQVVHPDYTGEIGVGISGVVFPYSLRLYLNAVLMETLSVTGSGGYIFGSQVYLTSDVIEIILQ